MPWFIAIVVLLATACAGSPGSSAPGSSGDAWCKPNPVGLSGTKTVKVDTGMSYTPKDPQGVVVETRALFLAEMQERLAGSALTLVEAQGVAPDILMTASVGNDGSDNFKIEVTCYVGGKKFYFQQQYPYTDVLAAIDAAAGESAGLLRDGWSCD